MWAERVSRYLLPGKAENDRAFHDDMLRLSGLGLLVVAGVQVSVSLFMLIARLVIAPDPATTNLHVYQGVLTIVIGLVTLACFKAPFLKRRFRVVAVISGLLTAATLMWFSILQTIYEPTADDFIPGQITLVLLVGVAAIPLRPTDTLIFGLLCETLYVLLAEAGQQYYSVGSGIDSIHVLFIFMLTLLATGLSAVLYEQRRSSWMAHQESLRAAEELRQMETRNLLAQNAASVGRLAAALSHELNNPIGALVSGVDTLLLLAGRQATAAAAEQPRLVRLQADLRRSIKTSTDRLKELITKMQRFTNLDRAEVQMANINEILGDVMALLDTREGAPPITTDFGEDIPEMVCRPQQLSAVFANLINNAVEAIDGSEGKVCVKTRVSEDSSLLVEVCDTGRGLSPDEIKNIFDPGFKASHGRVSAVNWSMFSSRQIVEEHGGTISINSRQGEGTCIRVVLPTGENSTITAT